MKPGTTTRPPRSTTAASGPATAVASASEPTNAMRPSSVTIASAQAGSSAVKTRPFA